MNQIRKMPVEQLGYDFIPAAFLPPGKDEYYLRNTQQPAEKVWRALQPGEVAALEHQGNVADNWEQVRVTDPFLPRLVKNCAFFGSVRIGRLEALSLDFRDLRRPVGLYNSTIISCDLGDNVVVEDVHYLAHYIIGNEVMIVNVNEMAVTARAKFGNGMLKQGEKESQRIFLEICNENGGRKIVLFDGMLPGDAWIWSRFRDNHVLQDKLLAFTDARFDDRHGFYGVIGDRTVIKSCKTIKDVWVGTDAYIKGANKLKNLTINSNEKSESQIGEGCELVNGIIGAGCRIFYGVKAVRFLLASHSQLKYGARLINSFLGNNATISCCEVLNSLIFPAHEQHHNNSFLCAALLMGQTNMAAGATIGSNHNSRGADGEMVAGRGFWPGLCVSLKHNSRFASFIIIAKGDYPNELDIPLPFSLVSNDVAKKELQVMPAYWFMHNMYALARNAGKYADRDKRIEKPQYLEYDYLAPDTVQDIIRALAILEEATGRALAAAGQTVSDRFADTDASPSGLPISSALATGTSTEQFRQAGRDRLARQAGVPDDLEVTVSGFENSSRRVLLRKVPQAWQLYRNVLVHYAVLRIREYMEGHGITDLAALKAALPAPGGAKPWANVGGQLIRQEALDGLLNGIVGGAVSGWNDVHAFYLGEAGRYDKDKLHHALDALYTVFGISVKIADGQTFNDLLKESVATAEFLNASIQKSRRKDYQNAFRKMLYGNQQEMDEVLGKYEDNGFIREQELRTAEHLKFVQQLLDRG